MLELEHNAVEAKRLPRAERMMDVYFPGLVWEEMQRKVLSRWNSHSLEADYLEVGDRTLFQSHKHHPECSSPLRSVGSALVDLKGLRRDLRHPTQTLVPTHHSPATWLVPEREQGAHSHYEPYVYKLNNLLFSVYKVKRKA